MISFPKGLIGFIGYQSFALLNLPEGKARYLKLLQSTDEASLGFYVLPVTVETSGFEATDIADAAQQVRIPTEDLAILLVVTARRTDAGVELTANLRRSEERRDGKEWVSSGRYG